MDRFNSFCISSYLAFRYVATADVPWKPGFCPAFPIIPEGRKVGVTSADEILASLRSIMAERVNDATGILLSGGIDSAILAALLPPSRKAFTIRFVADGAVDESIRAGEYAKLAGLEHHVVDVTWSDYQAYSDLLMRNKKSPLHAVEVGLYKTGLIAQSHGVTRLVLGNGADSTFGGLDKLLSRDWTFEDFIKRYTFIDPALAVAHPEPIQAVYEPYRQGNSVDVVGFLKTVHGLGVIQAFGNAMVSAGCSTLEPYEELYLDAPLDIARIRRGESKYLVREVFKRLYPSLDTSEKIAFARPMDQWLADWEGPKRPEFRRNLDLNQFSGDQKWLLYSLEQFLNILETS